MAVIKAKEGPFHSRLVFVAHYVHLQSLFSFATCGVSVKTLLVEYKQADDRKNKDI